MQHALAYAELGFRVFPLHSIIDGICTCRLGKACRHPGKHPRTRHGVKDATVDPEQIERWWKRNPTANVGIACGTESGVFVLDVDPLHGGDLALEEAILNLGELPPTVVAETGGDGRHHFFEHPGGSISVKNVQGVAPGIDVRGDAGYVVAAPSNHFLGGAYSWLPSFDPWSMKPATLPVAWLEWLCSRGAIWTPTTSRLVNDNARLSFVTNAVDAANSDGFATSGACYREIQRQRVRDTEAILGGLGTPSHDSLAVSSLDELTDDERQAIRRAIQRNLPQAPGERNQKRLFAFTRAIAGIPRLRSAGETVLRAIVKEYFDAASPRTSGTHCFEDYLDEFLYALDRVRFPGEINMIEIIESVAGRPPHPVCSATGLVETRRMLLVGLCAELQERHGEAPFFLSCETAAKLLRHVGHPMEAMQAHRMLDGFRRIGLLKIERKGDRHNATRWRFLGKPPAVEKALLDKW